mgnify:CR=1 FL=1
MVRILILLILFLSSCSTSKEIVTATNENIPKPTYLQPDTCLTDKQLKTYLNFVKDSMRIELKRDKQASKKEIDSLKIELKMLKSDNSVIKYVTRFDTKRFNDSITKVRQMYSDSLKVAKVAIKQENKTVRTEVRQENKTERAKLNRWWIFFIGVGVGVVIPIVFRVILKRL